MGYLRSLKREQRTLAESNRKQLLGFEATVAELDRLRRRLESLDADSL